MANDEEKEGCKINEGIKDCEKIFVADTSVILHDPGAIQALADKGNVLIIPLCVLEELNRHKTLNGDTGFNSRSAIRFIDSLRKNGKPVLNKGIQIEGKGFILVDSEDIRVRDYFPNLDETNDNRILAVAKKWQDKKICPSKEAMVVTKDISLRIKADAVEISAEDYRKDKVVIDPDQSHSGYSEVTVVTEELDTITELRGKKALPVQSLSRSMDIENLLPNHCLKLMYGDKYSLAVFKRKDKLLRLVDKPRPPEERKGENVYPKNDLQALLDYLLMDESITCLTVGGKAGTGKSLIALRAGYKQLIKGKKYESLLIYKPVVEVGEHSLGSLPGDLREKMEPWEEPIYDVLSLILGDGYGLNKDKDEKESGAHREHIKRIVDGYRQKGLIEISPVSHIRGRSLNKSFIVVDETQNLSPHTVKSLITRVGEGSKIVLIGDVEQIDNPYLDERSNGLTKATQLLTNYDIAARLILTKGERSELAELVARLM